MSETNESFSICVYRDPQGRKRCTECGTTYDLCICPRPNELAHRRLWSSEGRVIRSVWKALEKHHEQFPNTSYLHGYFVAEAGKVTKLLTEHSEGDKETATGILQQCILVAALATRLAVEGDPYFEYDPDPLLQE